MGQHEDNFAPLPETEAKELEAIISDAKRGRKVVVIDPDTGVTGARSEGLVSPSQNTNGLVRFKRHYGYRS